MLYIYIYMYLVEHRSHMLYICRCGGPVSYVDLYIRWRIILLLYALHRTRSHRLSIDRWYVTGLAWYGGPFVICHICTCLCVVLLLVEVYDLTIFQKPSSMVGSERFTLVSVLHTVVDS